MTNDDYHTGTAAALPLSRHPRSAILRSAAFSSCMPVRKSSLLQNPSWSLCQLLFIFCFSNLVLLSALSQHCPESAMSTSLASEDATAHSAVTIALSKKESAEHLEAMGGLYEHMRSKPLLVKAYALDDPNAPPDDAENVKTVHFVRHGQGFHNLMADLARERGIEWEQYTHTEENPYIMPAILDAPLTEKGRQQAYVLQPTVQSFSAQPELVVLSPNCRALQTGVIVFEHLIGKAPFVAHEAVREENGVHVCDKRRPKSRQAAEFPMVDFSLLETEEDIIFRDERRETKLELGARIYEFFEWLATRSETNVAVASHSGWLFTIFNGACECDESLKPWFQTGELRSVKLEFSQNPSPSDK